MKFIAIIPARYESSRLPKKMLADINGKLMVQRVYETVENTNLFQEVIVATDHEEIFNLCFSKGVNVEMTSSQHSTGTDRIAEVARKKKADVVINIQGDEPFIERDSLLALKSLMEKDNVRIGTLYKPINKKEDLFDFNTVKLIKDVNSKVLYFSRQAIPSHRDIPFNQWFDHSKYFQHLGVYGFKKETLLEIVELPQSSLEKAEKLEQLRWLENGYDVHAIQVNSMSFGIDTEEDLEKARSLYK